MKHHNILILGAGVMQLPAIEAAKNMGWTVCLVDANPNAPHVSKGDYFIQADLKSVEQVANAAEKWDEEIGLDGVFTAGTDFSYTVAKVADLLGLPGIDPLTALKASDKGEMRKVLASSAVEIPQFTVLDQKSFEPQLTELELNLALLPGYPAVIKPVDNMGSRGIRRVDSFEEAQCAIKEAFEYSRSGQVIIEEYIEGLEFSLDAIVDNGEITLSGFADRHIFFPPYFIEMGHTMPTSIGSEQIELVEKEFIKGIRAIGIDHGAAKGDIKLQHKADGTYRAVICEIAARLSGGYMSGWTFPYASDQNVTAAGLRVAVGEAAAINKVDYPQTAAERAFISIPGKVKEIIIPDSRNFKNQSVIKNLFMRVKPGDELDFPKNNVEKCGNVIAISQNREIAIETAVDYVSSILIRLAVNYPKTEQYLLSTDSPTVFPAAFSLTNNDLIKKDSNKDYIYYRYLPKSIGRERAIGIDISNIEYPKDVKDWHGLTLLQLFDKAKDFGIINSDGEGWKAMPIHLFLQVLNRGSLQGLVWFTDFIEHKISEAGNDDWTNNFFKEWQ